jgi:hypothetical protein
VPAHIGVIAANKFVFFHQADHSVNGMLLTNLVDIGGNEVLSAEPHSPHGGIEGYFMNPPIYVEALGHATNGSRLVA